MKLATIFWDGEAWITREALCLDTGTATLVTKQYQISAATYPEFREKI